MKVRNFMQEFVMREDRPFDSCHASTLLKLKDGGVLTAYFGGSWEKSPDTAIWVSRRRNDSWESLRRCFSTDIEPFRLVVGHVGLHHIPLPVLVQQLLALDTHPRTRGDGMGDEHIGTDN